MYTLTNPLALMLLDKKCLNFYQIKDLYQIDVTIDKRSLLDGIIPEPVIVSSRLLSIHFLM